MQTRLYLLSIFNSTSEAPLASERTLVLPRRLVSLFYEKVAGAAPLSKWAPSEPETRTQIDRAPCNW